MNYILRDVFTDRPFGGNHWRSFPDAAGATDAELPDSSMRVRMFAPAMGITEDPACSMCRQSVTLHGLPPCVSAVRASSWAAA